MKVDASLVCIILQLWPKIDIISIFKAGNNMMCMWLQFDLAENWTVHVYCARAKTQQFSIHKKIIPSNQIPSIKLSISNSLEGFLA